MFFDEGLGLKHPYSEVSFPLGSMVALHASWQGSQAGLLFVSGSQSIAEEINRRSAFNSQRFAFFHEKSGAISSLVSTELPQLNVIRW